MEGGEGAAGGATFDGIIKGWPEGSSLNISPIPLDDPEKLKLWLACNIFLNQGIQEVSFTDDNGDTKIIKSTRDAVNEAIDNSFYAADQFIKRIYK